MFQDRKNRDYTCVEEDVVCESIISNDATNRVGVEYEEKCKQWLSRGKMGEVEGERARGYSKRILDNYRSDLQLGSGVREGCMQAIVNNYGSQLEKRVGQSGDKEEFVRKNYQGLQDIATAMREAFTYIMDLLQLENEARRKAALRNNDHEVDSDHREMLMRIANRSHTPEERNETYRRCHAKFIEAGYSPEVADHYAKIGAEA